jgi:hypothetical protein
MVSTRRRQLGLLALLVGVALLLWFWGFRSPVAAPSASRDKAETQVAALDDVAPIGLDRLARIGGASDGENDADLLPKGGSATASAGPAAASQTAPTPPVEPAVPPTPIEPTPPPMNLRFIGAVEVRSGVWVASLLTDHKELLLGKEGEIVANRYRIVKIGLQSVDLLETASGRQQRVKLGGS